MNSRNHVSCLRACQEKPYCVPRTLSALILAGLLSGPALAVQDKAAGYYEDALKRYEKNELPAAIIQLKNALQQDPKMLAAHLLLGKSLLREGNLKGAEAAFEEALNQGVNRGEVALPLGQVYLALGRPDAVIEKISPAGLPAALQVEVLTMRGNAYLELEKSTLASQSFENARTLDPQSATPLIAEAQMLLSAGKVEAAREKSNKALALAPDSAAALTLKASIQHVSFDLTGALASYDKALSLQPRHVDARVARAALLIDLKRDADAHRDLEFLKTVAGDEPRAAYLRAILAARQGDAKATDEAMKEVVRVIDPLPPAWVGRREQLLMAAALAHHDLRNYQKSREYLDTILSRNSRNIAAKKLLASIYFETRDLGRAQPLLESLNRSQPDDPQVMYLLGSVYLAQKHYAPASELLEKSATRTGSPEMRRTLAFSQLRMGETERGLVSLEKAFATNPADLRAGMALSRLYLRVGKVELALKTAETMVKQDAANLTALNFLGAMKGGSGDKAGARAIYQQILLKDADFIPAALNLNRLDISEKKFDTARQRLDTVLKRHRDNYQIIYEYGMLELSAGRPAEAIRHLRKAGEVQRTDPGPLLVLTDLYLSQNQTPQALEVAKDLAVKYPGDLRCQLALARAYLAGGDLRNARATLDVATRMAEYEASSQIAVARLQLAASNPDGAAYSVYKALQGSPDNLQALILAVQIEAQRGDSQKADAALKTLATKYPSALETAQATANLAMSRGQFPAAIAGYRKVLAQSENTGTALALVQAHMAAGEAGKAAAFLESWVKKHPNDLAAQKALAEAQYRSGQLPAARQSYQQVVAKDPDDAATLNNYANLLLQLNDPGAQAIAEKVVKLQPAQPAYTDTLGWILVSNGQTETGLRYLREARLRDPGNGEIRLHLAYALNKAGRKDEARDELRAALNGPSRAASNAVVSQLKKELGL